MSTSGISQGWIVIGGGNMARAIIAGGVAAGILQAGDVLVAEIDAGKRDELQAAGCLVAATAREAIARAEEVDGDVPAQVLLAVKPQMLGAVAGELGGLLAGSARIVVTILAGAPGEKVRAALGGSVRVVRAMPNLPAQIGRGSTAVCLSAGAMAGDDRAARALFAGVGRAVVTIDESLMDAYTAVAGSGPAYVFYLAEAMVQAAEKLGLSREVAMQAVRETIAGAGELLARTSDEPATLRAAVTSKGGVTAAAIAKMEERGVVDAIVRGIVAGRERGNEIAKG